MANLETGKMLGTVEKVTLNTRKTDNGPSTQLEVELDNKVKFFTWKWDKGNPTMHQRAEALKGQPVVVEYHEKPKPYPNEYLLDSIRAASSAEVQTAQALAETPANAAGAHVTGGAAYSTPTLCGFVTKERQIAAQVAAKIVFSELADGREPIETAKVLRALTDVLESGAADDGKLATLAEELGAEPMAAAVALLSEDGGSVDYLEDDDMPF